MRYLEDCVIGRVRARGDRVRERVRRGAAVSDPQSRHLDVGGAHPSPSVGPAGHDNRAQAARRGGARLDRGSARAFLPARGPTRNLRHPVR
jgi:hypothetical protein